MIIKDSSKIDQIGVGCILRYKGKFLIFERKKENVWGSVAGKLEENENIQDCIEREIFEKLGIRIKPRFFTTFLHFAYGKNVEYHLFSYELNEVEYNSIVLDEKEHHDQILVDLKETKKLKLFEDEYYCLSEYLRRPKLKKIRRISGLLRYQDKFLVVRRNVGSSQGDKWGLPGGKQDNGESDLETLRREIKEELDYSIEDKIKKIGEWTWHLERVVEFPLFEIILKKKIDVKLDHEHNDYQWVTEDEFFKMKNHVDGTRALILLIKNLHHNV
ncbi:MAG: NUDIX hydrolase [Nanoarchaeota archaeon]|nr:NUDIX hydrolase [Nanoarchaeota archaeon]